MYFLQFFISLMLLFLSVLTTDAFAAKDMSCVLDRLPVQSGGRIKPFGTFARETLQLIYGRSTYKGKPASEVVFTWLLMPANWSQENLFEVSHQQLKKNLKLNVTQKHFSLKALGDHHSRLNVVLQDLETQRASGNKLNTYFQAVERLEVQMQTFQAITSGRGLLLVPKKNEDSWISIAQFDERWQAQFQQMSKGFIQGIQQHNFRLLEMPLEAFMAIARSENPSNYPSHQRISAELHYNWLSPFKWAWFFYLLGALLFLASGWKRWIFARWLSLGGFFAVFLGFLMHSYGFALRIYLTGRPPVSNMYESVIWVAWGAIFFALLFEWWQRRGFYIFSACLVATLCLITADLAPTVLDPSLQPLVPVLRSNFWLIVHVMTITLGYSAFFLSFILSNIGLGYFLKTPEKDTKTLARFIQTMTNASYYVLQVGVVLLAAGTILGGVWADYSWGRFWGWDPKETWALIALLGYIAVLHGRLAGWLGQFGFLAWSSMCFSLILMAWYGVNFVLGAGLHSYGFGGGGVWYVTGFVALHFIYVLVVAVIHHFNRSAQT